MTTGDIKNNLRKLMVELKHVRYPVTEVDLRSLSLGIPRAFLPILHYVFLDFSVDLTEYFAKDYELYGKTDLRFTETVYKILRDIFHYKPPLTREQFLSIGYAERKIIELCDVLKKCREKLLQLNPKGSSVKITSKSAVDSQLAAQKSKPKLPQSLKIKCNREVDGGGKLKVKNGKDEDKENVSNYPQVYGQSDNKQNTTTTHKLEGNSRVKSGMKTVRWEQEGSPDSFDNHGVKTVFTHDRDTSIESNSHTKTYNPFPNFMGTTLRAPPKSIPLPATMTTIPKPSPELMLTPIGKNCHQPIPLSASRQDYDQADSNVLLIDLTDSTDIQQPKIIRHKDGRESGIKAVDVIGNQTCSTAELPTDEIQMLRGIVNELQHKLDTVLEQNNEMSARIVLLESRVKLMEEASNAEKSGNNPCVSRFAQPFQAPVSYVATGGVQRGTLVNSQVALERGKDYQPQTTASSSRNLLKDFNVSEKSDSNQSYRDSLHYTEETRSRPTLVEVSDDDIDQSLTIPGLTPAATSQASPGTYSSTGIEAISPFPTTDIHLKFSDPSTTATIINVERRLKETREMLANATKFAGSSF